MKDVKKCYFEVARACGSMSGKEVKSRGRRALGFLYGNLLRGGNSQIAFLFHLWERWYTALRRIPPEAVCAFRYRGILPSEQMIVAFSAYRLIGTKHNASGNTQCSWVCEKTRGRRALLFLYGNQPRLARSRRETARLWFEPKRRRALR